MGFAADYIDVTPVGMLAVYRDGRAVGGYAPGAWVVWALAPAPKSAPKARK